MPTENTSEDLEDAVLDAAVDGIAEVTVDGMSVRAQSLKDRLAVLDRRKNETAAAKNHFGLRNTQLISPQGGF